MGVDEIPVRTWEFVAATSSRIMPETEKTVIIKEVETEDDKVSKSSSNNSTAPQISPRKGFNSDFHHHIVATEKSGAINVYVQGDLEDVHREKETKCVFLTVHDVGTNHSVWENLIDHETFESIKKRAVFIHVDIPGQEDNAEDLGPDFHFPSMQSLGMDNSTIWT